MINTCFQNQKFFCGIFFFFTFLASINAESFLRTIYVGDVLEFSMTGYKFDECTSNDSAIASTMRADNGTCLVFGISPSNRNAIITGKNLENNIKNI